MDRNKVRVIFILGILVSILVACGGEPVGNLSTLQPTVWFEMSLTDTPFISPTVTTTQNFSETVTPLQTITSAEPAWRSMAIEVLHTKVAATQNARNYESTRIAQFSISCDDPDLDAYDFQVSSIGNWIAVSCGNKSRQKLIVQNKEGTRWVLKPEDFPSIESNYGWLKVKFWSLDEEYLFLTRTFAYSGGGDECFEGGGEYGLFQFNLKNGSWATIIQPTNIFPGYDIQFSSTGRRYAVDIDGITIVDFKSGNSTNLDALEVIDLSWSPDGRYLAYSVATCDEAGRVKLASVHAWDSKTSQVQMLFTVEKYVLYLESWIDDSTLRVVAKKLVKTEDVRIVNGMNVCPCYNDVYDIYVYDQYLRQLWNSGRRKSGMNSAQAGDLLKNISQ